MQIWLSYPLYQMFPWSVLLLGGVTLGRFGSTGIACSLLLICYGVYVLGRRIQYSTGW